MFIILLDEIPRKPLRWMASARRDLLAMPDEVQDVFGYALDLAQAGGKHPGAKVLAGFGSASVLELLDDDARGSTYRVVYTTAFDGWICVLHCFKKKSTSGTRTPRADRELIHSRLTTAQRDFEQWPAGRGVRG